MNNSIFKEITVTAYNESKVIVCNNEFDVKDTLSQCAEYGFTYHSTKDCEEELPRINSLDWQEA